jgi:hypothetical protein
LFRSRFAGYRHRLYIGIARRPVIGHLQTGYVPQHGADGIVQNGLNGSDGARQLLIAQFVD